MSYEPTNWQAGDIVTSAKLNKLEQGLANLNILIVHLEQIDNPEGTDTNSEETSKQYFRLDKTLSELLDADFIIFSMPPLENDTRGKSFGMVMDIINRSRQVGYSITATNFENMLVGTANEMTEYPIVHTQPE